MKYNNKIITKTSLNVLDFFFFYIIYYLQDKHAEPLSTSFRLTSRFQYTEAKLKECRLKQTQKRKFENICTKNEDVQSVANLFISYSSALFTSSKAYNVRTIKVFRLKAIYMIDFINMEHGKTEFCWSMWLIREISS